MHKRSRCGKLNGDELVLMRILGTQWNSNVPGGDPKSEGTWSTRILLRHLFTIKRLANGYYVQLRDTVGHFGHKRLQKILDGPCPAFHDSVTHKISRFNQFTQCLILLHTRFLNFIDRKLFFCHVNVKWIQPIMWINVLGLRLKPYVILHFGTELIV